MKKIPFKFEKLKVGMEVEFDDGERCTVEEISQVGFHLREYSVPWNTDGNLVWDGELYKEDSVKFILVPEEKEK